jgi:hypothetical protein
MNGSPSISCESSFFLFLFSTGKSKTLEQMNRYWNHQDIPEIRSGLYPELGVLDFAKNSSPTLDAKVARAVALDPYPSFE